MGRSCSLFLALLLWLLPTGLVLAQDRPPNVLLIISDDQAWTDYGFMGHHQIRTPNLDKLAAQSAVFTHAYTPTSLCRASLASIITGQYPHHHGITSNDPPDGVERAAMLGLMRKAPTIPGLLKARGYRSLQTGKWWEGHFTNGGFTDGMTTRGRHGEEGLAIGRETLEPIVDFIGASDKRQPWFIWYAPMMPHMPHNPPQRILKHYLEQKIDPRVAKYDAMCEWFDETVGRILRNLDERGLADETIVIFVADNGWLQPASDQPLNGARGAPGGKNSPYDAGLRTPLMIRWPGRVRPGRHENVLASTIDVAPTILAAAGVARPEGMDGVSLLEVARGGARGIERDGVFGELFLHTAVDLARPVKNLTHRWIRRGQWKLILPAAPEGPAELYDLGADPGEKQNLAGKNPERVGELERRLDDWWQPAK